MSTHELKPGDRVRVTTQSHVPGCQPGDKGTLLRVLQSSVTGEPIYVVAMDNNNGSGLEFYFLASDIEPDV
jgi:hypothetical protein